VMLLGSASVETDLNHRQEHWHDSIDFFQRDQEAMTMWSNSCRPVELMNFARSVTPAPFGYDLLC